jgi:hypothetical protein
MRVQNLRLLWGRNQLQRKLKCTRHSKSIPPSDSGETPKPQENPASEKEVVVEGQDASNEEQQEQVQKDGTNLIPNAPNSEEKNDALTNPEIEDKKVYFD